MKRFAFIQMLWYLCSFIGLSCYFIHSMLGYFYDTNETKNFPLKDRVGLQNRVEVFVLLGRWCNELWYSKYSGVDIAHHSATLFGAYVAFNVESCYEFQYILSQTNMLHVPMFIWYFGCKEGCYLTASSSTSILLKKSCITLFPHVWTATSAYRVLLTFFAVLKAYNNNKQFAALVLFSIGSLLLYLDINWQRFFFKRLKYLITKKDDDNNKDGAKSTNHVLTIYNSIYFTIFGIVSFWTTFYWN